MKSITTPQDRQAISDGKLKRLIWTDEVKNTGLFAHVTLKPGETVNYHVHSGEYEAYYILSGEGIYNDNGQEVKVKAGDVTYTADECGHAIKNEGNTNLEFIALIVKQ